MPMATSNGGRPTSTTGLVGAASTPKPVSGRSSGATMARRGGSAAAAVSECGGAGGGEAGGAGGTGGDGDGGGAAGSAGGGATSWATDGEGTAAVPPAARATKRTADAITRRFYHRGRGVGYARR